MIGKQILDEINRLHSERYTQKDISRKLGVSQQMISHLMTGARDPGKIRLETIDKMFPNAVVHFYGDESGSVTIASNNSNSFNTGDSGILDNVLAEMMADSVMSAESKVRAYEIINKYKGGR